MNSDKKKEIGTLQAFGFEIEKKTSFTSLAAFILAIWGVAQASFYYIQGSRLNLIRPERIIIFKDACYSSKMEVLNIVMPITITNKSKSEYSSILRDIEIRFFLGRQYVYDTESYVNYGSSTNEKFGLVGCDRDKDLIFFIEELRSAPIEIIRGGESYVQYIKFVPKIPPCKEGGDACYLRNYLSSSDGIFRFSELSKQNSIISFDVIMKYDDKKQQTKVCKFAINPDVVRAIEEFRHISVFCLNEIK